MNIMQRTTANKVARWSIYLFFVAAFSYYLMFLQFFTTSEYRNATLYQLLQGTAETPMQYRILTVWINKALTAILRQMGVGENVNFICLNLDIPLEYFVFTLIAFIALIALALVFRVYLTLFFSADASFFLSFSVFLILPFNFLLGRMYNVPFDGHIYDNYYYPYDIPGIVFFTGCLILLYKKRWTAYFVLFTVATFNRETTIFLVFAYVFVYYDKDSIKAILAKISVHIIIWAPIKVLLFYSYGGNPFDLRAKGSMLNQFGGNFNKSVMDLFNVQLETTFTLLGEPYFYAVIISSLAGTWLVPIIFWKKVNNDFLKRVFLVIIPFFIGMSIVGNLYELRIFGELIPISLPPSLLVLSNLFREEPS